MPEVDEVPNPKFWDKFDSIWGPPQSNDQQTDSQYDLTGRTWLVWSEPCGVHFEGSGPMYFPSALSALKFAHNEAMTVINHYGSLGISAESESGGDVADADAELEEEYDEDSGECVNPRAQLKDAYYVQQFIEAAPQGTKAEDLLDRLGFGGVWGVDGAELSYGNFESIHSLMSSVGDVDEWRQVLEEPKIECNDGIYRMPDTAWINAKYILEPLEMGESVELARMLDDDDD